MGKTLLDFVIQHKVLTGAEVPTVPVSTNIADWASTDIAKAGIAVNIDTDQIWYRTTSGILEITAGGGGEVNTASNVGAGTGLFDAKVGSDLQFRSLINVDTDALTIGLDGPNKEIDFTVRKDNAVWNANRLVGNAINFGTLGAGDDGKYAKWDNGAGGFVMDTPTAVVDTIYSANGIISANRMVTMGGNSLEFAGGSTTFTDSGSTSITTTLIVKNALSVRTLTALGDGELIIGDNIKNNNKMWAAYEVGGSMYFNTGNLGFVTFTKAGTNFMQMGRDGVGSFLETHNTSGSARTGIRGSELATLNSRSYFTSGINVGLNASYTIVNNAAFTVTGLDTGATNRIVSLRNSAGAVKFSILNDGKMAFHGAAEVAQQTITGSRGGNAALADLLTKLANTGLIIDSTTA